MQVLFDDGLVGFLLIKACLQRQRSFIRKTLQIIQSFTTKVAFHLFNKIYRRKHRLTKVCIPVTSNVAFSAAAVDKYVFYLNIIENKYKSFLGNFPRLTKNIDKIDNVFLALKEWSLEPQRCFFSSHFPLFFKISYRLTNSYNILSIK